MWGVHSCIGQALLELTTSELKEDLEVKKLGQRKYIMAEIKKLKKGDCALLTLTKERKNTLNPEA